MAFRSLDESQLPKVLYLSIYSDEGHYHQHQVAQLKTWTGANEDIYWLRGVGKKAQLTTIGNFINIPIEENFDNILAKRILGIRHAVETFNFDFIVLMNTSTYVNPQKIQILIKSVDKTKALALAARGSHFSSMTGRDEDFLAGNLIILSKSAARSLAMLNPQEWIGVADDIAISKYLKSRRIEFEFISRNDLTDFYPFIFAAQHRIKSWQNPKITVSRFYEIHDLYSERGFSFLRSYIRHYVNEVKRYVIQYPPSKGVNMLRTVRFALNQLAATAHNSPIIIKKIFS